MHFTNRTWHWFYVEAYCRRGGWMKEKRKELGDEFLSIDEELIEVKEQIFNRRQKSNNLITAKSLEIKRDFEDKLMKEMAFNRLSPESQFLIKEIIQASKHLVNFILYQYRPTGRVNKKRYVNYKKTFNKRLNKESLRAYLKTHKKLSNLEARNIIREISRYVREL